MDLHLKYRPATVKELVGQDAVVDMMKSWKNRGTTPHTILLHGPSGCGKTTIARIVANRLGIDPRDVSEINAANTKGIDMVRHIESSMGFSPMFGPSKMYIVDEAHQMTTAAQDSFLKPLEEPHEHVYFALCTTDPQKLKPTIRTRCTEVVVSTLSEKNCKDLLRRVCEAEKIEMTPKVEEQLIKVADGSARKLLVFLGQIAFMDSEKARLSVLTKQDAQAAGIDLCRALMDRNKKWPDIAKILKSLEQDPESVRRQVIGYASSVLLNNPLPKAALVLASFSENLYDTGKAGLVLQAYLCFHEK